MRATLATALLIGVAACGEQRDTPAPQPAPEPTPDPLAACAAAFDAAKALPPLERFAALQGCPICGGVRVEVNPTTLGADAMLKACGGACSGTARDRFVAAYDKNGRGWWQLAEDCPETMGVTPTTRRFASAEWFQLAMMNRTLGQLGLGGQRELTLPLPAWTSNGAGFTVPSASRGDHGSPTHHLTVTASALHAGPLPVVVLAPSRGPLEVPRGADYPGPVVEFGDVASTLSTTSPDTPVAVIAPREMPATRLVEVVAGVASGPAHPTYALAIAALTARAGWTTVPQTLQVRVRGDRKPGDPVIELVESGRRATVGVDGKLADRCVLPGVGWTPASVAQAAAGAARVVLGIAPGQTVQQVTDVVVALGEAGTREVVLWPATPAPTPPPPCPATP